MGEWVPVHKKDDPHGKTNYRPVTILVAVDKILQNTVTLPFASVSFEQSKHLRLDPTAFVGVSFIFFRAKEAGNTEKITIGGKLIRNMRFDDIKQSTRILLVSLKQWGTECGARVNSRSWGPNVSPPGSRAAAQETIISRAYSFPRFRLTFCRILLLLDPVFRKPISANRGLNFPNPGLKFNRSLDSVFQTPISANSELIGD